MPQFNPFTCRDSDKGKTGMGQTDGSTGYGAGEMTERKSVTEGLGSAMSSIWLRDVQRSRIVL